MSNPTDTNQASELFELCKRVYELTGWEANEGFRDTLLKDSTILSRTFPRPNQYRLNHPDGDLGTYDVCPLYTSDYLLEKLPKSSGEGYPLTMDCIEEWRFYYWGDVIIEGRSDTPLKALLKLTIALDDAGELSKEDVKNE